MLKGGREWLVIYALLVEGMNHSWMGGSVVRERSPEYQRSCDQSQPELSIHSGLVFDWERESEGA